MSQGSQDTIRDEVRLHYSTAIRLATTGGCCGSGPSSRSRELYDEATLAEALADGIDTPSYGCGNPFVVADLKPGDHVLDLGSGAGLDALIAARRVGDDGRVYGLDMTDDMLEVAQQNARKAGARNVVFLRGDLESIPLPSASVDAIISNCVVNLAPDKDAAFAEAARVLKTGGRLAISDIVVDGNFEGLPLEEDQIRAGLSWAGCMAGALTTTALRAILDTNGFVGVQIEILSRYSRQTFRRGVPAEFAHLPESVVDDLISRFTSSLISAVKS